MPYRTPVLFCLTVSLILLKGVAVWAQTAAPVPSTAPSQALESPVQPETIAARKAAVQARIEALGQANLPAEALEATRSTLEQILQTLTALETAFQQRDAFMAHITTLPQRLRELESERQTLEAQPAHPVPVATEALRSRYTTQLQAVRNEIQELHQQMAESEVRLSTIARELAQKAQDRVQMENGFLAGQRMAGIQHATLEAELLTLKRQLLRAETAALETEQEWLTKRRVLHDMHLSVAQLRRTHLQAALESIKQTLQNALQQEQAILRDTAVHIEQQLTHAEDATEALQLAITLENVEIRQATADHQEQRHRLGDAVLIQEKRNAQEKQHLERLASLVEKYDSGAGVVQRLSTAFERLRRERLRYHEGLVNELETRLRQLTAQMFALDDRLYAFDEQAEARLATLPQAVGTPAVKQREADIATVGKTLNEQKAALREQQQELTALVQEVTKRLVLHQEYKRLLDDGYHFVLTKLFWLRSAEPFGWSVRRDLVRGIVTKVKSLYAFAVAEQGMMRAALPDTVFLQVPMALLVLTLLWAAWRLHRHLRDLVGVALVEPAQQGTPARIGWAGILILQAAIWPAVVVLMAWVRSLFVPAGATHADRVLALVSALQVSALILWSGLLGHRLLQQNGWAQQFWQIPPDTCRSLRRVVIAGCLAAMVCLVPRHVLLTVPGEASGTIESLVLARALFLLFHGVLLVLIGVVGRRESLLMHTVLTRSREEHGLAWRLWPMVYAALLGAMVAIMIFDLLGYSYAAKYLGSAGLMSLLVLLALQGLVRPLGRQALHQMVAYGLGIERRWRPRLPEALAEMSKRILAVAVPFWNTLVALLSLALLLEIWGVSVRWLLTSPVLFQLLARAVVIGLIIGIAVAVIQASNVLTEYLLHRHITWWGGTHQFGRKFRTLAPLLQTLIRVLVIFVTVLVILEQLGVATSPLLAGVGIFGLAIGFASQSLIKDVINGLFILFEDSLSIGDIVMLRGIGGQVEKVTLRTVTIRDLSGNVHVIPNNSIDMVTNMTKDYSRYVLDVPVAYREDVDEVIEILREIDDELRRDLLYGKDILEPLEIMGLDRFEDSAMVIQARLKTRPIQQWRIGREFNRRMKKAFDARGIEMPFPHRTLYWGMSKDDALGAACKSAFSQPGGEQATSTRTP